MVVCKLKQQLLKFLQERYNVYNKILVKCKTDIGVKSKISS